MSSEISSCNRTCRCRLRTPGRSIAPGRATPELQELCEHDLKRQQGGLRLASRPGAVSAGTMVLPEVGWEVQVAFVNGDWES